MQLYFKNPFLIFIPFFKIKFYLSFRILANTFKKHFKFMTENSFLNFPATIPLYHSAAAATMSLQSCLTLYDPIDGSPPDSLPWDSSGKNTGVGCHFIPQCMKVKSESESKVMSDS